jgi:membrane-associated phospholipid phosphatase
VNRTRAARWPILRSLGGRLVLAWLLLAALGFGLGELARWETQGADLRLVREIASERTGTLTAVAHGLSGLGLGYVITPLAVAACVALYRRGRRASALAVAASVLGAFALSSVDKLLVGRPRPPVAHLETVSTASFPSGHAIETTALLLALLIAFLLTRRPRVQASAAVILTIALSSGVALSRVYLGVHYPSDVLGGVLLGAAWSAVAAWLVLASGRKPAAVRSA